jgi:hypothetical protein
MERRIEVYVRDVVKSASGETIVVGIPNNNISVKIGDLFIWVYFLSKKDILENTFSPTKLNQQRISLRVERIEVFRQRVFELSHGTTGGLYFSGEGIELIAPKCFISTKEIA